MKNKRQKMKPDNYDKKKIQPRWGCDPAWNQEKGKRG